MGSSESNSLFKILGNLLCSDPVWAGHFCFLTNPLIPTLFRICKQKDLKQPNRIGLTRCLLCFCILAMENADEYLLHNNLILVAIAHNDSMFLFVLATCNSQIERPHKFRKVL